MDTREILIDCMRRHIGSELWAIVSDIERDERGDCLDISTEDCSKVAYSPEGVARDDHKRRRKLTLGRYLSRQCGIQINSTIEQGISACMDEIVKLLDPDRKEFEILTGYDITQAYIDRVGGGSCMAGPDNSHISEWYGLFPDRISLLVWRGTLGRALLWADDEGGKWLDRIYSGNKVGAYRAYGQWCEDNGAGTLFDDLDGIPVADRVSVSLGRKAVDGRPVPYLDSLYYATSCGVLSNCIDDAAYLLQCTEGGFDPVHTCEDCECHIDDDCRYDVGGPIWHPVCVRIVL